MILWSGKSQIRPCLHCSGKKIPFTLHTLFPNLQVTSINRQILTGKSVVDGNSYGNLTVLTTGAFWTIAPIYTIQHHTLTAVTWVRGAQLAD